MDSYNLEEYLQKIFTNILHVDSNPAVLNTTEVFKSDGKIKHVNKKEEYILTEFIIESLGDLESTIITEILSSSDKKQIDFYPTTFFKINESLGNTLIVVRKDSKVVVLKNVIESNGYTIQLNIDSKYFSVITLN
jgi:hypothetical protein